MYIYIYVCICIYIVMEFILNVNFVIVSLMYNCWIEVVCGNVNAGSVRILRASTL